jgi:uncharacterized protein
MQKLKINLKSLAACLLLTSTLAAPSQAAEDPKRFISVVLKMTEDVWTQIFAAAGKSYTLPKVVLYTGSTPSGCGKVKAEMGPLYCPIDQRLYPDPNFYQVLATQLKAPGQFAQAYVIAHEIGHHIQNLTGILPQIRMAQVQNPKLAKHLQMAIELHADCLAGVWGKVADQQKKIIQPGDLESALNAATQIGDDNLAIKLGIKVDPSQFTHGTGEQRKFWFNKGFQTGDYRACTAVLTPAP